MFFIKLMQYKYTQFYCTDLEMATVGTMSKLFNQPIKNLGLVSFYSSL